MMKQNKNSALWPVGTALFVIGSMVSSYFFGGKPDRKNRNEVFDKQQEKLDQNLTTPANATFGVVWPVIYLGTAALAVHQALPGQRDNDRYRQARPWLLACYTLNALFAYYFSRDDKTGRVGGALTTIMTLPPALVLHRRLGIGRTAVPRPERTLSKSVSLYTGWLTVATVVSAGNLLIEAGYNPGSRPSARWAYAVLPFTAGLGVAVSRQLRDPYYLAPVAAGFTGIAAKQYGLRNGIAGVAAIGALATGALAAAGAASGK